MERVYECCCGLDVHKKLIVACLLQGNKQVEIREFATNTEDIRSLANWLLENKCQMIAMESTASYWKPLYNIFEIMSLDAMVVNAQHMKALPGRKTDVKDAQWIAELLSCGLLRASFIPDREQRELRELMRYRTSLVQERSRELNRLQKILEGANIKLASVVSEINGVSSRNLLDYLIRGEEPTEDNLKTLVHGSMLPKIEQITKAMQGFMTPLQRQLLAAVLAHIDDMSRRISDIDKIAKDYLHQYQKSIDSLCEIPGVGPVSASVIVAEIGIDMSRFPSDAHLSSWAGLSPGNNVSAGKSKSGKTTKGNKTLKSTLVQCAASAIKNKNSFLHAQYQRIVVRKGKKKAFVCVAHSMLIAIYHMLKDNKPFNDLGSAYYNQFNKEKKIKSLLKNLQKLGWHPDALPVANHS